MFKKLISIFLSFTFITTQPIFAQGVAQLDMAKYLGSMPTAAIDRFRPLHLRYFSYDIEADNFQLLLDKGDNPDIKDKELEDKTKVLMEYFQIGLALLNEKFWVNLRPDAQDQIIDPELEKTDLGKVMLESDLQLKKDTALMTSPQSKEGREYWDKLYQKARELFSQEPANIPTITRPWIVPGEIIVREGETSAYIFKANLKVMLEEDYLSSQPSAISSQQYNFHDPRMKELNTYSTQLIRELIIPKLTQEVNTAKRYAGLRQVFFSLIMARWFKERFKGLSPKGTVPFLKLIDSGDLTGLTSKTPWSKSFYFNEYKKSFEKGEYNLKEQVPTPYGQVIRSYVSGGAFLGNIAKSGYKIVSQLPNKFSDFWKRNRERWMDGVTVGSIVFISALFGAGGMQIYDLKKGNEKVVERAADNAQKPKRSEISFPAEIIGINYWEIHKYMHGVSVRSTKEVTLPIDIVGTEGGAGSLDVEEKKTLKDEVLRILLENRDKLPPGWSRTGSKMHISSLVDGKWTDDSYRVNLSNIAYLEETSLWPIGGKKPLIRIPYFTGDSVSLVFTRDNPNIVFKFPVPFNEIEENLDLTFSSIIEALEEQGVGRIELLPNKVLDKKSLARNLYDLKGRLQNAVKNFGLNTSKEIRKLPEGKMITSESTEKGDLLLLACINFSNVATYLIENIKSVDLLREAIDKILKNLEWLENSHSEILYSDSKYKDVSDYIEVFQKTLLEILQDSTASSLNNLNKKGPPVGRDEDVTQGGRTANSPITFGGIDLTRFNTLYQRIGSFSNLNYGLPTLSLSALERIDLDKELESLRNMVKAGMVPSGARVKEYLAAVFQKGKMEEKQDDLLLCLAEIYRLQEEEVLATSPELRESLVIVDTGRFVLLPNSQRAGLN